MVRNTRLFISYHSPREERDWLTVTREKRRTHARGRALKNRKPQPPIKGTVEWERKLNYRGTEGNRSKKSGRGWGRSGGRNRVDESELMGRGEQEVLRGNG